MIDRIVFAWINAYVRYGIDSEQANKCIKILSVLALHPNHMDEANAALETIEGIIAEGAKT